MRTFDNMMYNKSFTVTFFSMHIQQIFKNKYVLPIAGFFKVSHLALLGAITEFKGQMGGHEVKF